MKSKRGIEFNFAWLFAIIVGAVIIFIAVFATTSLIKTSKTESDTKVAAQLGILLNPIETSLEEGKYSKIIFPEATKIFNDCDSRGNFGTQFISASVSSGIGERFQEPEIRNSFFNKYLFSDKIEEGKELHVFVKPFKMPYKIADLVFASANDFCFVNPPGEIEDEVESLGLENVRINASVGECKRGSKKVCFGSQNNCDVVVDLNLQTVSKNGSSVYYEGDLIYGAIFAEPGIYECQLRRLMKRNTELAYVYAAKSDYLTGKGCSSNLGVELRAFALQAKVNESDNSFKLNFIAQNSKNIGRRNELLSCKLF